MITFLLAVISAIIVLVVTVRMAPDDPDGMAAHLPTLAGGVFFLASFVLLPWVSFAFLDYFIGGPEIVSDAIPKALGALMNLLGQEALSALFGLFEKFGAIPGWLLPFVVAPFAGIWHGAALLLGPIVSSISLVWLTVLLIMKPGARVRCLLGWLQVAFAMLAWVLLLLEMPTIDAIGSHRNFAAHFFAVASGARMTGWVWFAWAGLLLLVIGGLLEAMGVFHQQRAAD